MVSRNFLRIASCAALAVFSASNVAGEPDAVRSIVGTWDLVGTQLTIRIDEDHTVHHWSLGSGDIEHENARYFKIRYRQHHLECRYDIKIYSDTEAAFMAVSQPAPQDCDLGVLRRTSGALKDIEKKNKQQGSQKTDGDAAGAAELGEQGESPLVGATSRDCPDCPDLISVPSGTFVMGSPETEAGRDKNEGPTRQVDVKSFAVGKYPVTNGQFDRFVSETGYNFTQSCNVSKDGHLVLKADHSFRNPGYETGPNQPVTCVTWDDAQAYIAWLSGKAKKPYRLLTEAEREYVTRAGTTSPFWWGGEASAENAAYYLAELAAAKTDAPSSSSPSKKVANAKTEVARPQMLPRYQRPVSVYSFPPNPWGLHHVHGNVAEWTQDCWSPTYYGLGKGPDAVKTGDCERHPVRGGSWAYLPRDIRAAYREPAIGKNAYFHVSFRIARDVD